MKRGFLVNAGKKQGISDKRGVQKLQPSKPKDGNPLTLEEIGSLKLNLPANIGGVYRVQGVPGTLTYADLCNRIDIPSIHRLPYGNINEQKKGEDADNPRLFSPTID